MYDVIDRLLLFRSKPNSWDREAFQANTSHFLSVILDHKSVRYILNLILLRLTTVTTEQVVRQFGVASHQVIVKIFKQKCQRKWQFHKIRCVLFILFIALILTSDWFKSLLRRRATSSTASSIVDTAQLY